MNIEEEKEGERMSREKDEPGGRRRRARPRQVVKMLGADTELGNFILGGDPDTDTCREASQALLREIDGLPLVSTRHAAACNCAVCRPAWRSDDAMGSDDDTTGAEWGQAPSDTIVYDPQDRGRKFLASNGGCAYIDMNHLELCVPEVRSARDHVAAWHAMLRIARRALEAADAGMPEGQNLQVLIANSDGFDHSYGSHLNFLLTRRAWDNLFYRKLQYLLTLASYQVSSIIFTGQGKVGSENGAQPVDFQLSQRADFFETLTAECTMFRRPIVNNRNEPLCGDRSYAPGDGPGGKGLARLHVIFYDATLSHVATFLKVGVLQIVLAMIEAEALRPDIVLDDPLVALRRWSHDPTLRATALMTSGQRLSAIEVQLLFLEEAKRFVDGGGCDGIVPDCRLILDLWEDTLKKLQTGDLEALAPRLDWALKLLILEEARRRRRITWGSPEMKRLDLAYGNLDADVGLYWVYERAGLLERVAPEERIAWFVENPPEDTRAWARAMLLRRAEAHQVDDVDWDRIRFSLAAPGEMTSYRKLDLGNPLGFTRREMASLFTREASLGTILDTLGADHEEPRIGAMGTGYGGTGALRWPVSGWHFQEGGNGRENT
jgi:proteasome accessory factor A